MVKLNDKRMLCISRRILGNEQDAQDAVQTTIEKILKNPENPYKLEQRQFDSYLRKALISECNEIRKKQTNHPELPLYENCYAVEPDMNRSIAIQLCLDRLRPQDQEVLMLHARDGYKFDEIAAMLNSNRDAIAKRYERAKKRFDELCKEEGIR